MVDDSLELRRGGDGSNIINRSGDTHPLNNEDDDDGATTNHYASDGRRRQH